MYVYVNFASSDEGVNNYEYLKSVYIILLHQAGRLG